MLSVLKIHLVTFSKMSTKAGNAGSQPCGYLIYSLDLCEMENGLTSGRGVKQVVKTYFSGRRFIAD